MRKKYEPYAELDFPGSENVSGAVLTRHRRPPERLRRDASRLALVTRRRMFRVVRGGSCRAGPKRGFVRRKSRVIGLIAAIFLFAALTRMVVAFVRYEIVERRFSLIQVGDTRDSVMARLGRPNYYRGKCGVIHVPDANCSEEFVYSHPFAPIIPEYHIVGFSTDGHVIEADDWNSP